MPRSPLCPPIGGMTRNGPSSGQGRGGAAAPELQGNCRRERRSSPKRYIAGSREIGLEGRFLQSLCRLSHPDGVHPGPSREHLAVEFVDFDGLRIAYRRSGSTGPPLVLVHGAVCDSRVWRVELETLSDEFAVVAWDAPGCGA